MNRSIAILIMLTACAPATEKSKQQTLTFAKVIGLYTGTIPCADCEGIYTRLEFIDSVTYIKESNYLGKSSRSFYDMGQWSIVNDSVISLTAQGNTQRYWHDGYYLTMLDAEGKRIEGMLANNYKLTKGEPEGKPDYAEQVRAGVDFVASGNEPFWNLELDFDKDLYFNTLEGDSIRTAMPTLADSDGTTFIRIKPGKDSVVIALASTGCVNSMSGAYSHFFVSVRKSEMEYTGCGALIGALTPLHGTWKLTSINREVVDEAAYPLGLPTLTFNTMAKVVSGTTGCNQLNGSFRAAASGALAFAPLATTRMFCENVNETAFLKALEQTTRYKIEGEQLMLLKGQTPVLIFASN
jgi:heat shock protein HslJ/uncharacterized lipoprotein NlpE involved in copper resistance